MAQNASQLAQRDPEIRANLARLGALVVRLAETEEERAAALALRHEVFIAERGFAPTRSGLETDPFDADCAHLIVCAQDGDTQSVIGTCRLMMGTKAAAFYCNTEFHLAPLLARHKHMRFCEVGRACIAPGHRAKGALDVLWRGLFVFAAHNAIDVYFGPASFPGTDPSLHATALAWLARNARDPRWMVCARQEGAISMTTLAAPDMPSGSALRHMPPLLRGYLRIGAYVAPEAFIDRRFGTIDVLVLAPLANAPKAWHRRFAAATGMRLGHRAAPVGIAPELL